jgi:3',5'-cyclic AMP phosphodiesterase CpdA
MFSYIKWRLLRGAGHRNEVLETLTEELSTTRPDHIAVTGDLTHMGLNAEIESARDWLQSLGGPERVTAIPGNHDIYIGSAEERFTRAWAEYLCSNGDEPSADRSIALQDIYPALRVYHSVAVIGVSSARPCNPLTAIGTVGERQLQKLESILAATGAGGLFRVVLIHHPPLPGIVSWRKRLTDAKKFAAIVSKCGAELVLHGHAHFPSHRNLAAATGEIPVNGVSSASAWTKKRSRRAGYDLYRIEKRPTGWNVDLTRHVYCESHRRFETERESGPHR